MRHTQQELNEKFEKVLSGELRRNAEEMQKQGVKYVHIAKIVQDDNDIQIMVVPEQENGGTVEYGYQRIRGGDWEEMP